MDKNESKLNIINYFNYLQYESIESLQLTFSKPVKDNLEIYNADLNNKLYFFLPKSNIKNCHEDELGRLKINYKLNIEQDGDILEFLDNLDSLAINVSCENSELWFKNKFNTQQLSNMLTPLSLIDDENVYLNIYVNDFSLLDKINQSNKENKSENILIEINSIEFYKNNFNLKLILENVVYIENEDTINNKIDFNHLLENVSNNNDHKTELNNNSELETNFIKDNDIEKINYEIIDDLAEKIEEKKIINLDSNLTNELELLITKKKIEKQKHILNAKRAQLASESLSIKAKDTQSDIDMLITKLNETNNSESILKI